MHGFRTNEFVSIWVLTASLLGPSHATADRSTGGNLRIEVRVYDLDGVSAKTLAEALKSAEEVFDWANVETLWLNCSNSPRPRACTDVRGPARLTLQIVPESIAARYPYPSTAFGFAMIPRSGQFGVEACVYSDRARKLARKARLSLSTLLGHMMAHEVGHLLLGSRSHRRNTIMAGWWQPRELRLAAMGRLRFSARDAETIRANMIARAQAKREQ